MESLPPSSIQLRVGLMISYPQDDPDIRAYAPRKKQAWKSSLEERYIALLRTVYHPPNLKREYH